MDTSELRLKLVQLTYNYGLPLDEVLHRSRTLEEYVSEVRNDLPKERQTLKLKSKSNDGNAIK